LDEALNQPESSDESSDESQSENADNQPEVIEIKSYEYYGKISLNNNLKVLCVFTFIMVQTNIFLSIISLFNNALRVKCSPKVEKAIKRAVIINIVYIFIYLFLNLGNKKFSNTWKNV
jgi:CDP-diglyceride synthetase